MGDADRAIIDGLLALSVDLVRLEGSYNRSVLRLLREMEAELVEKLSGRELTTYSRQRLLDLLAEARSLIAQTYVEIRGEIDLKGIAQVQAQVTGSAMSAVFGDRYDVAIPSGAAMQALVSGLLIQGAPSSEWWTRQAGETQFRFAQAVRQGVAQGETNAQIVARIRRGVGAMPPVIEVSRRNAEALVRTSVQTVANAGLLETFKANDELLAGYRQISTLDGRTSTTCVAYSGAEWDLEGSPINGNKLPFNGGPPRHWNCRSVLTPIVKPLPGLPDFGPSDRASVDGPVRADITFGSWLDGKSKTFQNNLLGEGRADLWREGKITLPQLLDQRGRPLTLDQLRQKYS